MEVDESMKNVHTNGMKIAISIPDEIFREVDRIAKLCKVSRSRIFVQAVKEYSRKLETRRLLRKLNEVWSVPMAEDEEAALRHGQELSWDAMDKEPYED